MTETISPAPPIRVWSLIVTVFGDIVMDRGTVEAPAPVWIAPLLELLARLGVDAASARTNFSRLVANGTLEREKAGRNTFYRLSAASRADFHLAARRIYGQALPRATGAFRLALIERATDRAAAREQLSQAGYRFISPGAAIWPEYEGVAATALPAGVIGARAEALPTIVEAAHEAWQIEALAQGYCWFIETFDHLTHAPPREPESAITSRVLLVHHFRRLVLRDPFLHANALPPGWPGHTARTLFDAASLALEPTAKRWLAAHDLDA